MTTISQLCLIFIFPILHGAQTQTPTVTPASGEVRLAGGSDTAGRVEVYWGGEWGTVCDNDWGIEDANIVCNQLGFPRALSALSGAAFGEGSGPVHYDYVACFGGEPNLNSCSRSATVSCLHDQDASVSCLEEESTVAPGVEVDGNVRLVGGNDTSGRVEVYIDGVWGTVCDDRWNVFYGHIVCRQLGFRGAVEARDVSFGPGVDPIHLSDLDCVGNEANLLECSYVPADQSSFCSHDDDAGVVCLPPGSSGGVLGEIRLAGLTATAGRVEVYDKGEWGTVCDNGWDIEDANIVCNFLGFPRAVSALPGAVFGEGSGPVHYDHVACFGGEPDLYRCSKSALPTNCSHDQDASVVCLEEEIPVIPGVTAQPPPPPTCEPLQSSLCGGMPYNQTVFPNAAGFTTQEEAEGIVILTFEPVIPLGCPAGFFQFMCLQFMPPCDSTGVPTIPCKELCETGYKECITIVQASGVANISFDFDCSLFPAEESGVCFAGDPSRYPYEMRGTAQPQSLPPPTCEPLMSSFCGGMPYNQTEFPSVAGFTTQEEAEGILSLTFEPVIPLGCPAGFFQFMCLQFMPPCDSTGVPTIPCKELCETGLKECITIVQASGVANISFDFDCSLFPAEESGLCFAGDPSRYPYEMGLHCTPACGANETCSDVGGPPNSCVCAEGYTRVDGVCQAKTCDNSCNGEGEDCTMVNGYSCTCQEGYTRPSEDWPCTKTPVPTQSTMPPEPPMTTEPGETTKREKTSESTKPSESTKSPSTPDAKNAAGGHKYTGAIVGLFIFLVATCLVFVAVYLVRRKLRNNYGRLDEDTEGDSGWSAFSKNPIYRGDRDYQLL